MALFKVGLLVAALAVFFVSPVEAKRLCTPSFQQLQKALFEKHAERYMFAGVAALQPPVTFLFFIGQKSYTVVFVDRKGPLPIFCTGPAYYGDLIDDPDFITKLGDTPT